MGPGPAGIPQIEYLFSRLVCISVPLGYTLLLVILVIAGIKYLTSGGEPKAVQAAHYTVSWGLLGIVFLALAWLILQLIQNFTGIEVTKFTLTSLPGVEGFTGSCWEEAPISKEEIRQKNMVESSISQTQDNVATHLAYCEDAYKYMRPVSTSLGSFFTVITYPNNPFSDVGFKDTLDEPKYISVTAGSIDGSIWNLNLEGAKSIENILDSLPQNVRKAYQLIYSKSFTLNAYLSIIRIPAVNWNNELNFTKFEKGIIPKKLATGVYEAQQSIKSYLNNNPTELNPADFEGFNWEKVHLIGFACPDADFYSVVYLVSPLIYIYPPRTMKTSLKIHSPIVSAIHHEKGWEVTAYPKGQLITYNNKKLRFIPYEFLRKDFRRPDKGIVVNSEHLVSFLKDNLWKSLGLTTQEIEDYWNDLKGRIPNSPYYFISLIDRTEIDRVLPMEVNPEPDAIIRNMTYILPLDQSFIPIPLPEEKLKAPQRKGFTVLENGGFIDGF